MKKQFYISILLFIFLFLNLSFARENDKIHVFINGDAIKEIFYLDKNIGLTDKMMQFVFDIGTLSPKSWSFEILDEKGKSIFTQNTNKNNSKHPPVQLQWNGLSDTGSILNDGTYTVQFSIKTKSDTYKAPIRKLILDRKEPFGTLGVDRLTLFPSFPRMNQTKITFYQNLEEGIPWEASIVDKQGNKRKNWNWIDKADSQVTWDGKDDEGNFVEDGLYDYVVFGTDKSSNINILSIPSIKVMNEERAIFLDSEQKGYSHFVKEKMNLTPFYTYKEDIKNFDFRICYDDTYLAVQKTGVNIPEQFVFDGTSEKQSQLPEGSYSATLKIDYKDDVSIISKPFEFFIDSKGPNIDIDPSRNILLPDGNGKLNLVTIHIYLEDISPIQKVVVELVDQYEETFRKYEFEDQNDISIIFDGLKRDQSYLETGDIFTIRVTALDLLGNQSGAISPIILVGFITDKRDDGRIIRDMMISYEKDSISLSNTDKEKLDKLISTLKNMPSQKIEIRAFIGSNEKDLAPQDALALTHERAKIVKQYLVENGIEESSLEPIGMGSDEFSQTPYGKVLFFVYDQL